MLSDKGRCRQRRDPAVREARERREREEGRRRKHLSLLLVLLDGVEGLLGGELKLLASELGDLQAE